MISRADGIGWSVTHPGIHFINVLKEHGIEKPIDINRDGLILDILNKIGTGGADGVAGNGNTLPIPIQLLAPPLTTPIPGIKTKINNKKHNPKIRFDLDKYFI